LPRIREFSRMIFFARHIFATYLLYSHIGFDIAAVIIFAHLSSLYQSKIFRTL
jgi:hypothetical protein